MFFSVSAFFIFLLNNVIYISVVFFQNIFNFFGFLVTFTFS
jgi:hypothetical protein